MIPITDITEDNVEQIAKGIKDGRQIFERFSPKEQRGLQESDTRTIIASLIAGRENSTNPANQIRDSFKRTSELGKTQEAAIEHWAKKDGCWYDNTLEQLTEKYGEPIAEGGEAIVFDNGDKVVKTIGLDYFVSPQLLLDRIILHNYLFPETAINVIGFGRYSNEPYIDKNGDERYLSNQFNIIVEQPFVKGEKLTEKEIEDHIQSLGFELKDSDSWTYTNKDIYLSDLHDENVLKAYDDNGTPSIAVIDADIRLNDKNDDILARNGATREVDFNAGIIDREYIPNKKFAESNESVPDSCNIHFSVSPMSSIQETPSQAIARQTVDDFCDMMLDDLLAGNVQMSTNASEREESQINEKK